MKDLEMLDIRKNKVTDLSPLRDLTALKELQISGNELSGPEKLKPLEYLTNLKNLEVSRCNLSDISFVARLSKLEVLKLKNNHIKDLTPLAQLKKLTELDISYNPAVEDLSPLLKLADLYLKTLIVTVHGDTLTVEGENGAPISNEQIRRLLEDKEKDSH
jgi:Leucine-rich repeat (LRR) protein